MSISDKFSKQKKILVIKLSGSVFNFKTTSKSLKEYAQLLLDIQAKVQPVVVSGGGIIARHYVNLARSLGSDESSLDEYGYRNIKIKCNVAFCSTWRFRISSYPV